MSKSWFWAGSPARWWDRSQWRLLAWAAIGATRCFQQELFIQRKTPRAMAAENARTLHAKQRRQSSIPRTPFSRSALPGDDPHRNACMPVTARSVRCCAASACGGGRFQGLLPVMANDQHHPAAEVRQELENRSDRRLGWMRLLVGTIKQSAFTPELYSATANRFNGNRLSIWQDSLSELPGARRRADNRNEKRRQAWRRLAAANERNRCPTEDGEAVIDDRPRER